MGALGSGAAHNGAVGDGGAARRWLFADQLGPHFSPAHSRGVLLVESRTALRRRTYHRQKLHLVLSALRHRARELFGSAVFVRADTYRQALAQVGEPVEVCEPTSRAAEGLVSALAADGAVTRIVPTPGFTLSRSAFADYAGGRRVLRLEDFYRWQRRRLDLLVDGDGPEGGRWNYDTANRYSPPRGQTGLALASCQPVEDDIDAEVRADLDRWTRTDGLVTVGVDGPRLFAATRREALAALRHFVTHQLPCFGPYEDAMMAGDWAMAHSRLSAPMNLGLLHPLEVVEAAIDAYRAGTAPLESVEGFVRQVVGWREYVWQLYWHLGPDYRDHNHLVARRPLPGWFADLDADGVGAACLSDVLAGVRDRGWVHHIPRLMVLGNWALQRGYDPDELTEWFVTRFVDGYDWVMSANVVGMSQHADGGVLATKPYASGGAYIHKMSDYCGGCRYDPKKRVGQDACPFTAGYWWFVDRNSDRLAGNYRLSRPLRQLERLRDRDELVRQEEQRGSRAP